MHYKKQSEKANNMPVFSSSFRFRLLLAGHLGRQPDNLAPRYWNLLSTVNPEYFVHLNFHTLAVRMFHMHVIFL